MIQYSIGELIDRLTITNLKIFHIEEDIKENNEEVLDVLKKCEQVVSLNKLRNELIQSINEFFNKDE